MTLMRVFSKVDKQGRIPIPSNIRREVGLEPNQLVEIKVTGTRNAQYVVIHKREQRR